MLASTRRRILASRSARSRYKRAFSRVIAACEASSSSTVTRSGVNACVARLFSRYNRPINAERRMSGRHNTDFGCRRAT
jgi:hypothetical protein